MKRIMFLIAVAITLSFVFCTKGAPIGPPAPEIPMGSEVRVNASCITLVKALDVRLNIMKTDTQSTYLTNILEVRIFSSKNELDAVVRERAKVLVQSVSNRTDLDFANKQLKIIVDALYYDQVVVSISIFGLEQKFYLSQTRQRPSVKVEPPYLDTLTTSLPSKVVYKVPGVRWVTLESMDAYGTYIPLDSRNTSDISINNGFISIPIDLVINPEWYTYVNTCSGSGVNTAFVCYDDQGRVRPERFTTLGIVRNANSAVINITGGEAGRVLIFQESSDLVNWTTGKLFTRTLTQVWATNFTKTMQSNPTRYYKVSVANNLLP